MACTDDPGCRDTLDQLYEYLDGELDSAHLAQVKQHLAYCNYCLQQYGLEREVRTLVARSCGCHAPDELRRKIMTKITQIRVEGSLTQTTTTFSSLETRSPFDF